MRSSAREQHVEVLGSRLWTRLAGPASGLSRGTPPVVFIPGGGGIGLDFAPAQALLAAHTTTLLYDRAGTGQSQDAALPRSAASAVAELKALLDALELPAPYLLVGHSLGGVYAQHFAQRHPADVAGLVLIDPAHEDFDDYMPDHLRISTRLDETSPAPEVTPELLALAREQISGYVQDWPQPLQDQLIDLHTRPDRVLVGFHESGNLGEVISELRHGDPRPHTPITVLSAAGIDSFQLNFTDEHDLRSQIDGTERLAAAIAARGEPGEHLSYPDDSHAGLPMRRPDGVATAVTTMLQRMP